MGMFSNEVDREKLKPGDHIYSWRQLYVYAHHGIYVGDGMVTHFTRGLGQEVGTETTLDRLLVSSVPRYDTNIPCPRCGDPSKKEGVISSCLDCFLYGGNLYLFAYGVSRAFFLAQARGGTCTCAPSDPTEDVLHRASILLEHGFGAYDISKNNCEDFAIYCKTGLLVCSGQAASCSAAAEAVFSATFRKMINPSHVSGWAMVGHGMYSYCVNQLDSDIGRRHDASKIPVESLIASLRLNEPEETAKVSVESLKASPGLNEPEKIDEVPVEMLIASHGLNEPEKTTKTAEENQHRLNTGYGNRGGGLNNHGTVDRENLVQRSEYNGSDQLFVGNGTGLHIARTEAERRKKEEAERLAKLAEIAEKQRQREREVEEKERQRREALLGRGTEPASRPSEPPTGPPESGSAAAAGPAPGKYVPRFKREKERRGRKKEEAERLAEIAEKQRQRERELEENERQRREALLVRGTEPASKPSEPPTRPPKSGSAAPVAAAGPAPGKYVPRFKREKSNVPEAPPPETDRWTEPEKTAEVPVESPKASPGLNEPEKIDDVPVEMLIASPSLNELEKTTKTAKENQHCSSRGRGNRGGRFGCRGGGRGRRGRRPSLTCQVCLRSGHSAYNCYYRFDYNYLPRQSTQPVFPHGFRPHSAHLAAMPTTPQVLNDKSWFPDSGATNHATTDCESLVQSSGYNGSK